MCRSLDDARGRAGCAASRRAACPCRLDVGAVLRAARHLVDAVRPHRPRADDLVLRACSSVTIAVLLPSRRLPASRRISFGGVEHGADDLVVAGAAAEVAGQPVADRASSAFGLVVEQRLRRDDEARRADAALQRRVLEEACCSGCRLVAVRDAFDRRDRRRPSPRRRARSRRSPARRPGSRCRRRSCRCCSLPSCRSAAARRAALRAGSAAARRGTRPPRR